jgi:MFS family permease
LLLLLLLEDVTGEGERTRSLGLVGAAFGLGFIVGPALGGTLVGWHPRYPALAAALLSFINLIGTSLTPLVHVTSRTRSLRSLLTAHNARIAGAYFLLTESLTAEQMKAAQDTRKQSPSVLSHSPFLCSHLVSFS